MSGWTHNICIECWQQQNPDREPVRVLDSGIDRCCFCGRRTGSGIYVRHDPDKLPLCEGHGRRSINISDEENT